MAIIINVSLNSFMICIKYLIIVDIIMNQIHNIVFSPIHWKKYLKENYVN
ncbi:hypothetical protein BLA29_013502 [Euroglyphus maynei]|uniref:Uncharacterized protein n=1 Tax=Euroglyphus maynei TaxID=6958 RepID=A0A1Y3BRM8_EURMA|nr:hypothetical protein BLA29_013502 [Euroglyphus maynei]